MMDIDYSELERYDYQCLDDCGLCCLCQPELDDDELAVFRKAGLEEGLTNYHVQGGQKTDEPTAIKLQGGRGACHFLKDLRCQIHDVRPRPCRQFPVQIHLLRRVQINANLACPGIFDNTPSRGTMAFSGKGGESLLAFGKYTVSKIPQDEMEDIFEQAVDIVKEFDELTLDFSVYQDPGALKEAGNDLINGMKGSDWIARTLAWSNEESIGIDLKDETFARDVLSHVPEPDIQEIANEGNNDLLDQDDLAQIPVFVDEDMNWVALRSKKNMIDVMKMEEDGSLETTHEVPMDNIKLMDWTGDGTEVFQNYAKLLNDRDPFMGYVYQVCADQDFQFDLATVYIGTMATTMLDLWWRASLLGLVKGESSIDQNLAKAGIKAFDMTSLGAPSIGLFI